jgi:predicted SAM-dependent methyltransferase
VAARYLRGQGIEIGALHLPLRLPRGAKVTYVDRYTTTELRRNLPELSALSIVEVDVIDDGEHLASLDAASQDFVIANHMIEHCEDPIGTIRSYLRVLRPGGMVFMAVPDKRRSFDRHRPRTTLAHVLEDYRLGPRRSRAGHYAEWAQLVEGIESAGVSARAQEAEELGQRIHFHVWTRTEFRRMLDACSSELDLPLVVELMMPNLSEFLVVFRRTASPLPDHPVIGVEQ